MSKKKKKSSKVEEEHEFDGAKSTRERVAKPAVSKELVDSGSPPKKPKKKKKNKKVKSNPRMKILLKLLLLKTTWSMMKPRTTKSRNPSQ